MSKQSGTMIRRVCTVTPVHYEQTVRRCRHFGAPVHYGQTVRDPLPWRKRQLRFRISDAEYPGLTLVHFSPQLERFS